jgi:hypothetical protein
MGLRAVLLYCWMYDDMEIICKCLFINVLHYYSMHGMIHPMVVSLSPFRKGKVKSKAGNSPFSIVQGCKSANAAGTVSGTESNFLPTKVPSKSNREKCQDSPLELKRLPAADGIRGGRQQVFLKPLLRQVLPARYPN